jgi:serine/threonine protein kinase
MSRNVYKCENIQTKELCAVKIVKGGDAGDAEAMRQIHEEYKMLDLMRSRKHHYLSTFL